MAFDAKGIISDHGGAAGTRRWTYHTPDNHTTVEGAGYFSSYAEAFEKGDVIEVVASTGGTPALRHYVVTAVTKPSAGTPSVTVARSSATAA